MKTSFSISILCLLLAGACKSSPECDATGIFEATTIAVSSETTGRLLSLNVSEGDSINQGDIIAVVDSTLLLAQQKQVASQKSAALSSLPDVSAQAAALRSRIAHQEEECRRLARLLADGAATQKSMDDANAALTTLKAELAALLSSLSEKSASMADNAEAISYQAEQIGIQIDKGTLLSPITGTVLETYAEPGEFMMPGKPVCKIADLDKIFLRAYFTVAQLADVNLGQKVTVIADFGEGRRYEYPGTVSWISQESEFTPKSIQTADSRSNLVYAVKITVKNDGRLKLGQYGEVKL